MDKVVENACTKYMGEQFVKQKIQMAYRHVRRCSFSPGLIKMHKGWWFVSLFLDKQTVLESNGTNNVAGGHFLTMPGE